MFNTSERSRYELVMRMTERQGVTAAIDNIGGIDSTNLARCTREGGTFICMGLLSGEQVNWNYISKNLAVKSTLFLLSHWIQNVSVQGWQDTYNCIFELVQSNCLKSSPITGSFDLTNIKEALYQNESPERIGKVLLTSEVSI